MVETIKTGDLVQPKAGFEGWRSRTGIVLRTFYSTTTWIDGKEEPLKLYEVFWGPHRIPQQEPEWKIEKIS